MKHLLVVTVILALWSVPAKARDYKIRAELEALVNTPDVSIDAFSESFRAKVSKDRLESILSDMRHSVGPVRKVTGANGWR